MKVLILTNFTDKYNGTKYNIGEIVEFKDKRAKELLKDSRNLVEKVVEEN